MCACVNTMIYRLYYVFTLEPRLKNYQHNFSRGKVRIALDLDLRINISPKSKIVFSLIEKCKNLIHLGFLD